MGGLPLSILPLRQMLANVNFKLKVLETALIFNCLDYGSVTFKFNPIKSPLEFFAIYEYSSWNLRNSTMF